MHADQHGPLKRTSAMVAGLTGLALLGGCESLDLATGQPKAPPPSSASAGAPPNGGLTAGQLKLLSTTEKSAGGGKTDNGKKPGDASALNVTPFSNYKGTFHTKPQDYFVDAYTRLVVVGVLAGKDKNGKPLAEGPASSKDLPYKTRTLLTRWLWGEHHAINLTAKVTVGQFVATVPLVSIDHVSDSKVGEQHARVIYHEASNYPVFLVRRDGTNAIVSIQFTLKANDDVESSVASETIQVAQQVAKSIAPQSAVFTTLSQQSTKDLANAIDTAINQLMARSLSEQQWVDKDIRYWHGESGATVTFRIPVNEGDWGADTKEESLVPEIGQWVVTFAPPRPSIFSDIQICLPADGNTGASPTPASGTDPAGAHVRCVATRAAAITAIKGEVKSSEVLSYPLLNAGQSLGSIKSFLTHQDWYNNAMVTFARAGASPTTDDVANFCRAIKSSITEIGLSGFDAEIVTDAVKKGMPLTTAVKTRMGSEGDCGFSE
jgi:hypothetical protein